MAAAMAAMLLLAAGPSFASKARIGRSVDDTHATSYARTGVKSRLRHRRDDHRNEDHGSGGGQGGSGSPGSTPTSLQQLMDSQFGPGVLTANGGQMTDGSDAHWTAEAGATSSLLLELASYAPYNVFGVYDTAAPGVLLPLFSGAAGPGAQSSLAIEALVSGAFRVTATTNGVSQSAQFGSSVFGFYLQTPAGHTFFSNTALNGDGFDHLHAYSADVPAQGEDFVRPNSYLLAWEDLLKGGDRDYDDLVLTVHGYLPSSMNNGATVPLPAGIWLLVSGALGLAGFARRRRDTVP